MTAIYDVIRKAFSLIFGPVLYAFYNLTGSYVLSIVALTLIIRLLLLPVSIKQQKNSAKQVRLNTKVCEITESGVACTCGGENVVIPADAAACAFGTAPLSAAADSLRFTAPEFFQIGDCLASKNIAEATRLAHFAALDLGRFR